MFVSLLDVWGYAPVEVGAQGAGVFLSSYHCEGAHLIPQTWGGA